MRSWAYNRFGVLMGASWLVSGLRWPSLRVDVVPMITLFPSQGYFCATAFTASAVMVQARLKTKPIRQWDIGREFNRRMKKLFDERGIALPFPHLTLYWGEPKRGEAVAMPLTIRHLERLTA